MPHRKFLSVSIKFAKILNRYLQLLILKICIGKSDIDFPEMFQIHLMANARPRGNNLEVVKTVLVLLLQGAYFSVDRE
jgi:hypothetical protein